MGLFALTQKLRYNPAFEVRKARLNAHELEKLALGILTALAMLVVTYLLPRGGALRKASLGQFPMTVGVWAIFVLYS